MPVRMEASAPVRVDLAGGWTDVGPYPVDFGGEVVNFAINRRVFARMDSESGLDGAVFEFQTPRGSGLGTSSAMNVALSALTSPGDLENPAVLAEKAYVLESKGGNMCGRQDQWASAYGGFNHLLFIGDSVEVMPFEPMRSAKNWLKKHLIIAFSGKSRESGEIQKSVWDSYSRGDQNVSDGLHIIRGAARLMANGLQQDRRDLVVESLRHVCDGVDLIDKSIHEPFREVIEPLLETGSLAAWKALGAGGGGCAALLCSPNGIEEVTSRAESAGWEVILWDFEDDGIILNEITQ
tara:strand:+ start:2942 stop:3823 length:882 start_codon:yes stop_codon:yes gene_type:complete